MYVTVNKEDYEKFIEQKRSLEYKVRDMVSSIVNLRNLTFGKNLSANVEGILFLGDAVVSTVKDFKSQSQEDVYFPASYLFDDNYMAKERAACILVIEQQKKNEETVDDVEKKVRIQQAKELLTKEGIIRDSF